MSFPFPKGSDAKRVRYGRVRSILDAPPVQVSKPSDSALPETSPPISSFKFENLPTHVFDQLTGKLTYVERMVFRAVSRPIRQRIDNQKIGEASLEVTESGVQFRIDDLHCDYEAKDYGCYANFGDESKWCHYGDTWVLAKTDFGRLLNLTRRIEKMEIRAERHSENFFNNLCKTLSVSKAVINTDSAARAILVLSMMNPGHLNEVSLKTQARRGFGRIFETDHFRTASSWKIIGSGPIEEAFLEHFWNLAHFEVKIPSVTVSVFLKIKQKMLENPHVTSCQINSDEHINVQEVARSVGKIARTDLFRHRIPIPGDVRVLEVNRYRVVEDSWETGDVDDSGYCGKRDKNGCSCQFIGKSFEKRTKIDKGGWKIGETEELRVKGNFLQCSVIFNFAMSSQSTSSPFPGKSDGNKRKIEVIEVVGTASPPAARLQIASSSGSVFSKQPSSQEASEVKRMKIEVTDTLEAAPSPTPSVEFVGFVFKEPRSLKVENVPRYRPDARFMVANVRSDEPELARELVKWLARRGLSPTNIRHMKPVFKHNGIFYTYYFDIVADEETEEGRKLIGIMEDYVRLRPTWWMDSFTSRFRTFSSRALSPNEMFRAMAVASRHHRSQPQLDLRESINDKEIVKNSMDSMKKENRKLEKQLTEEGKSILRDIDQGKFF
ncbi:unnamed protein product [Caenorhabditis nigoni]